MTSQASRSENEPREISRRECPQCGQPGKGCECAYNGGFTEVWYVDKAAYVNARAERDITLERLEAAEGERDRLREAADEFREDVRQFALLTPRDATPDFEALLKRAQEFRAALSTGDRQHDDSHVRTAEATQPEQARQDSEGGAS